MQKSLMVGLNEKDMEAVIRTYDLKDYYYPTRCLKRNPA